MFLAIDVVPDDIPLLVDLSIKKDDCDILHDGRYCQLTGS